MKDKEFDEKVEHVRKFVLDYYRTIDLKDEGMAGMMDMLIESVLLLAEVINEKGD